MLGTALASTFLISTFAAPAPASAQVTCPPGTFPPPDPIVISNPGDSIDCVNVFDRSSSSINVLIGLQTNGAGQFIDLNNSGVLTATTFGTTFGILSDTDAGNSPIFIVNSGDIRITSADHTYGAYGIFAQAEANSPISISNSGDIVVNDPDSYGYWGSGLDVSAFGANSPIDIWNTGKIVVNADNRAYGINALASDANSPITIWNSGDIWSTATGPYGSEEAYGIQARGNDTGNSIAIHNSGNMTVTAPSDASGIFALAEDTQNVGVTVWNSGDLMVTSTKYLARGIVATGVGNNSPVNVTNSGNIWAVVADGPFTEARGLQVGSAGTNSPVTIVNSGSIYAQGGPQSIVVGIQAGSDTSTTIINSGHIGASSNLAIQVPYGPVDIFNTGTITGFVLLDADDRFINQAGGTFEARQKSDFDAYGAGGNDLFRNQNGATVHANGNTSFVNLERFENQGLISMVDGATNDTFTISNTLGGTNLNFVASGDSTLAVDAFLGGPSNSSADTFTIEGNVSGVTTVAINNTNTGPGVFNPAGIRVITVTGKTPNANAFQLAEPIDTGFFDYDLFFTPTGSGFWELRSFPGGGAFLLPQLVTAAQDIWHEGSSTWFDRTADLRVLLNGGPAPSPYGANGTYGPAPRGAPPGSLTPAVWARGSGSWLERDDIARATAYGRSYQFNLDRDLTTVDFQMGLDLGKRDLMSQGDILVFGVLGGFVHGDLDYDSIARQFNFDGGQVGAYATYLNGGLFVDTLFNAHLYSLSTDTLGFPDSLDASTWGVRTDAGYRFGSFSAGPFLEPLATLEVTWADIDGFSLGGNTVSFDNDANVRGRLGMRAGTTMEAWQGTLMEPFVIGSLWGNFTDDNQATLVSTGRTFRFQDELDDVWGEVSGGVNFFNFSQTTAVFAKVDVTFGDDVTGVGGKAGMRVAW